MDVKGFVISNKLSGNIKLSSLHSLLPFWNSLSTLMGNQPS